ncbi:MAG: hypothetical protein R3194_12115, partial [Limnobacter sp.]|nr:hypothetical protein [Limnobacter sp.]
CVSIFETHHSACVESAWWTLRLQDVAERSLHLVWRRQKDQATSLQSEARRAYLSGAKEVSQTTSCWTQNDLVLSPDAKWVLGQCKVSSGLTGTCSTDRRWLDNSLWQLNANWDLQLSGLQFHFDCSRPTDTAAVVFSCTAQFPETWAGQSQYQTEHLSRLTEPQCLGEMSGEITAEVVNTEDTAAGVLSLTVGSAGSWVLRWLIHYEPQNKKIVHCLQCSISDLNLDLKRHDPWSGDIIQRWPVAKASTVWEWRISD